MGGVSGGMTGGLSGGVSGGNEPIGGITGGSDEPIGGISGGMMGGMTGGMSGGMIGGTIDDPVDLQYRSLVIQDVSSEIDQAGTPGVDVCEVIIECDTPLEVVDFSSNRGESPLCNGSNGNHCLCTDEINETCATGVNRTDPPVAYDGNNTCTDNYVSLGLAGRLILNYNTNLVGCTIQIIELAGQTSEAYHVKLCTDATLVNCLDAQNGQTGTSEEDGAVSTSFLFNSDP